jgi:phage terminase large subunit
MELRATDVFYRNMEAYLRGDSLILDQGGQGSSKTYSILQVLYGITRRPEEKRITVCSYALPHLRLGAMADFEKILKSFSVDVDAVKNKTDSTYTLGNSVVDFFGIEGNLPKAHGPRRDILFINEANKKVSYEVYDMLATRTQGTVFLDFNPDRSGWIQETVMPNFKHTLIKSTYLDNPWLPEREVQNIESKRDKPGFEMWWQVYGLGELGVLEGAIFQNWRYGDFDTSLPFGFGMDFGYNDPDVMVKVAIDRNKKIIYCDEKIYKSGNTPDQLQQMMAVHCKRGDQIIADSADPKSINMLNRYFNIKGANKKKWSVSESLRLMQDYEIVITESSGNLAKELNYYCWHDKKSGVPIGEYNHCIDSIRYYFIGASSGSPAVWHTGVVSNPILGFSKSKLGERGRYWI